MSKILISMKQHGASMRFNISIKDVIEEEISKEYNIHNFAIVRFKTTADYRNYEWHKNIRISMMKHEYAKHWTFTVNVTSESYSADTNCSENWSDWINIREYVTQWFVEIQIKITIIKIHSIAYTKFYKDETLTDFELSTEDGSVAVHRAYLAAHSEVFKTMFHGQWKETAKGRVEHKGVTQQTLQDFKDFIYLGTLPDVGLCPLLLLATRYLVDILKAECMMKIMQTITAENLDAHLQFAVENEMHELKDNILEIIPYKMFATACAIKINALMGKKEDEE